MEIINRSAIEEFEVHRFVTEASALRWPAGYFPIGFHVGPEQFGNGQPFYRIAIDADGAIYRQGNGCIDIKVWND